MTDAADRATFENTQQRLDHEAPEVRRRRAELGLDDLLGPMIALVINVEPDRHQPAVSELLSVTGYKLHGVYRGPLYDTAVLKLPRSADLYVRSRRGGPNPFAPLNDHPKSNCLPNTRLETMLVQTPDLEALLAIQRQRGVAFLTDEIIRTDSYLFIQTAPSRFTHNSIGYIQWLGEPGQLLGKPVEQVDWPVTKPDWPHLQNLGRLDHLATRLPAADRDDAMFELMWLAGYNFEFSIYVEMFNSITNVTRPADHDAVAPAVVFTSGIRPLSSLDQAGPTEKFVHNYGRRVHHLAFDTAEIDPTFAALTDKGMGWLVELVGSPDEGLKQCFSTPSENTLLVNEYIQRYEGFDGFFTKSNVTALTAGTDNQ